MSHLEDMKISINGVELTNGQKMTVHVALQDFKRQMSKKHALGEDNRGESIRKGYLDNIQSMEDIYL